MTKRRHFIPHLLAVELGIEPDPPSPDIATINFFAKDKQAKRETNEALKRWWSFTNPQSPDEHREIACVMMENAHRHMQAQEES